jgi:hypothetical protein
MRRKIVSKAKNNSGNLRGQNPGSSRSNLESASRNLLSLTQSNSANKRSGSRLVSFNDLRRGSLSGDPMVKEINFGRFSAASTSTTSKSSGSIWQGALKSVASGNGLAGLIGGGLASFTNIGGIVSGIKSLFHIGEKAAPPPLAQFQLPESRQQTVVLGNGSAVRIDNAKQVSSTTATTQSSNSVPTQYQSSQITQAVKLALLHSSSLNDIISEL